MAKFFNKLSSTLTEFIGQQKMFFVGTAAADGRINVSPKGMDALRVLDGNRLIWLNLTGSGNETAAHVLHNGRMTIMFCSFEGNPLILRLYGTAKAIHPRDDAWEELVKDFPDYSGKRQIFDMHIDSVQTSCGFAVPLYDFQEHRDILDKWATKKSDDELKAYWNKKNTISIDGLETGI